MLKERLEGIRQEVLEQDAQRGRLRNELQATREDLKTFKLLSKQDSHKMKEVSYHVIMHCSKMGVNN